MGNKTITFDKKQKDVKPSRFTYADISLIADRNFDKVKRNYNDAFIGDYGTDYKFARNLDVNAVKRSVRNMFEWIPGERILLPEYGNVLRDILYEGITDFTAEKLINELQNMVFKWEPRAEIDKVFRKENVEETENNQMSIVMIWHVKGLPNEQYQEEILL